MQNAPPPAYTQFSGDVPLALQYSGAGPKVGLSSMRSVRNFQCENQGTFSPANPVIRIPVFSSSFLDLSEALLCFDVTVATGLTTYLLDGGAQCMIQQLRILSASGNEVERIPSYNLIAPVIDQYTDTESTMRSKAVYGGNPAAHQLNLGQSAGTMTVLFATAAATQADAAALQQTANAVTFPTLIVQGVTEALDLDSADTINATRTRSYKIPLTASGWFNTDMGKLFPPNTPFILEITLAPALMAFAFADNTAHTACDYTWINTFLKIPQVTVKDAAFMEAVAAQKAQGMTWSAQTYKLYTNTITTTGSVAQCTVNISDRSRSLNALIGIARAQSKVVGTLADANGLLKLSKRSLQYLTQWQYTIGSDLYPPQPINFKVNSGDTETATTDPPFTSATVGLNIADAWSEAEKVFGKGNGIITPFNFANSMVASNNGTGVFCIDLRSYHTDKRLSSGIDTASTAAPVTLRLYTSAINPTNNAVQLDIFARCDAQFVIVPGTGELRSMI